MTGYVSADSRGDIYNMVLPRKGPLDIPITLDFQIETEIEVDFTQVINNGFVDYISGVYLNNSEITRVMTFKCSGTNQVVPVPAGFVGFIPLMISNPPVVIVSVDGAENSQVSYAHFTNIPLYPFSLGGSSGGAGGDVNIASVGGNSIEGLLGVPVVDYSQSTLSQLTTTLTGGDDVILSGIVTSDFGLRIIAPSTNTGPMTINYANVTPSTDGGEVIEPGGIIQLSGKIWVDNFYAMGTLDDVITIFYSQLPY